MGVRNDHSFIIDMNLVLKVKKGLTLEQIAEDLEYSQEEIAPIYAMVLEEMEAYKEGNKVD